MRGLVDYVRSFAPTSGKSRLRSRNEPAADDFDERFHRLQERMDELRKQYREQADVSPSGVASKTSGSEHHEVTQKGVLGWFLAGFHLTDASRVLMTHRWLGTTTVACAALVLTLSEAGRPPDRGRTRLGFRVALLVVALLVAATGFFGGAVVYGLDHYAWPR